ncbi:MAG: GNAT family N-acetyltransferase [Clostridia bacterium]|nr:GNAT family N-acetyltransferase [Clostridia bacterium]
MDIRLLDNNDIDEAKALWKSSFDDSDEFIDTYFKNKISIGNSLGLFDDGLASVVHMLPCKIRVQANVIKSAYIAGAATAESKRNNGYMRQLLYESLSLMRQRGIFITHLYPFKHSFYERLGWATYSYVNNKVVKVGKQSSGSVVEVSERSKLVPMYRSMMAKCDGYAVRTVRQWENRLSELFSDGGKAVVLIEDNKPSAYMMYYGGGEVAEVVETVFESKEKARRLAEHLALEFKEVQYSVPAKDDSATPYGMARIVDVAGFLESFDTLSVLNKMQVVDSFATWNNKGNSRKRMDIADFTQIVHRGAPPQKIEGNKRKSHYNALNEKFIQRSTCIFEQY